MRIVFFIPPLSRPSGGLAVIYRMAELLAGLGHEVLLAGMSRAVHAAPAESALPFLDWDKADLKPRDVWCVPESWPNALALGFRSGARTLVYAQNWVFMLGNLPPGANWSDLPVEYIAVSQPVSWFLEKILAVRVKAVLPPSLLDCFFTVERKPSPAVPVRVAWMPRKNKALAEQIQRVALALLRQSPEAPEILWVPLRDLAPEEVAAQLASCHIFLCSSLAEGFGLPPLEAMAAGCVPVGFAGLGGWEYMRGSALLPCCRHCVPPLPLPERPWGANGFFVSDGDVLGAGQALAGAALLAASASPVWKDLVAEGRKAAGYYSGAAMRRGLENLFS
ncbi:MAG: glycosyltransferase [Deltaproteobacteria bacterium]|jgi:glycosyltransferase involved in cell wall biosynthesis|nr:glycosyltransferase [Deltaproteobacteria bacterium]